MKTRSPVIMSALSVTLLASGCGTQQAQEEARRARAAEQQARERAERTVQLAKRTEAEAKRHQSKMTAELERLKKQNMSLRKQLAEAKEQLARKPEAGEPDQDGDSALTHVIVAETAYYTTGPQQGRPPDGKLKAGTQVTIVHKAGSYALVRTANGIESFVASDAINPIEQPMAGE